ncbi:sodium bile acid symporter family-domain-containing protein [Tricharina praecox]|uniref:sodium bile acid symporter family-domain-containing protein n=1 Tax=Tricharina praecox TaxID=43433 RepID=UPI0022212295|nr:sodium bile acid symporter family-domain-containing protein [Tricharina praecox]KAI5849245.1 sodium bile acid symporter family-domain-containing protein [Tricharina praecox]
MDRPSDDEKNLENGNCVTGCDSAPAASSFKQLSFLDRFLAIWIFLAMAIGIILGYFVPETSPALQRGKFVDVSIPIAVGLLIMMYPILVKVRYEMLPRLLRLRELWIQIFFSVIANWVIAPLFMLALSWAFLPDRPELREGLILVGVARCIAMVLIWTDLAGGDGEYCAMLVAFNSMLQIVLFAPLAVFYIRVVSRSSSSVDISYEVVAKSVAVFLGIPLAAAVVTRFVVLFGIFKGDIDRWNKNFVRWIAPWSLIGLLFTILVLFASQSRNVVGKITSVLRVCAPLVVYFLMIFAASVWACRLLGHGGKRARWGYEKTATQSLTAASNNFELAIAVAVACYGAGSEQALAATVGPLVEVPVLLALVEALKWLKPRMKWEDDE